MFDEYKKEMTRNSAKLIIITTITSLLIAVTSFIGPLLIKDFVESYPKDRQILKPLLVILLTCVVCYLFKLLLSSLKGKMSINFKTRETCQLILMMFKMRYEKLIQLEPTYLVEKINTSVNTFYQLYSDSIASYIVSIFTIIGCLCFMLCINVWIAVILIVIIPLNIAGYKLLNKRLQKMCIRLQNVCAKNFADILSITSAVDYIKQSPNYELIINFIKKKTKIIHSENANVGVYAGLISLTLGDIINMINNLLYIYVTVLMVNAKINLADYIFITMVISMFFPALNNIVGAGINLRDIKGVYEFVENELINNIEESGEERCEMIENVSFDIHDIGYNDKLLIKNGHFDVKRGDIVMIQGESGSGKTTIMKGLVKLLHIDGISLNGKELSEYDNNSVRAKIAFFSQNVPIITGTIKENILLGQNEKKLDINKLKNKLFMKKFFDEKEGLDHIILENGSNLSGGDKQKIALARLYLEQPDVIILDEITSSIDKESSDVIFEDIINSFKESIIFVIAHDDTVKKYCNRFIKILNKECIEVE